LKEDLIRREVHLIAAYLNIPQAVFPSKILEQHRARTRGWSAPVFVGEMVNELEAAQRAPFAQHLNQWKRLLEAKDRHGFLTGVGTCPSMMLELSA